MLINTHALAAFLAFFIGGKLLFSPKGTSQHKKLGYVFVGLMLYVSFSALFIQELNQGHYSLLHLLVPVTIISLLLAIIAIRKYRRSKTPLFLYIHQFTMISTFVGGLCVAGFFAFWPGRHLNILLTQFINSL